MKLKESTRLPFEIKSVKGKTIERGHATLEQIANIRRNITCHSPRCTLHIAWARLKQEGARNG